MGSILGWYIKVGDEIEDGYTAIAEIEATRGEATITFEAIGIEGYCAALLHKEDAKDIKVGDPLFIVVEEKEDVAKFADYTLASVGAKGNIIQNIHSLMY